MRRLLTKVASIVLSAGFMLLGVFDTPVSFSQLPGNFVAPFNLRDGTRLQVMTGSDELQLNIRNTPDQVILGTQPNGALGTHIGTPVFSTRTPVFSGDYWSNVNFDLGVDGWALSRYLAPLSPTGTVITVTEPKNSYYVSQKVAVVWSLSNFSFVNNATFPVKIEACWNATTQCATLTPTISMISSPSQWAWFVAPGAPYAGKNDVQVKVTSLNNSAVFGYGPAIKILNYAFNQNDRVQTTASANVRSAASRSGAVLGTQLLGSRGTITNIVPTSADGYYWWNVNFDSGVDGWVIQDNLRLATTSSITVISPNGGETWQVGTTQTIRWSSATSTGPVSIGLFAETSTSSAPLYVYVVGHNLPNTGSYQLPIQSWFTNAGSRFKIRIGETAAAPIPLVPCNANTKCDESDAPFTISSAPVGAGNLPANQVAAILEVLQVLLLEIQNKIGK